MKDYFKIWTFLALLGIFLTGLAHLVFSFTAGTGFPMQVYLWMLLAISFAQFLNDFVVVPIAKWWFKDN